MRLGRGFTAVTRKGVTARRPGRANCRLATNDRRSATGLAARARGNVFLNPSYAPAVCWESVKVHSLSGRDSRFPAKIALFVKTLPHFPVLMRLIRGAIVDFRQAFHQNRGFAHESLYLSGQRRHHGGQAGSPFQNAALLLRQGGQSQFHPLRRAGDSQSGGERPAAGGYGASCRGPGNLLHRRGQRKRQLVHPLRCSRDGQKARHYLRRRASRSAAQLPRAGTGRLSRRLSAGGRKRSGFPGRRPPGADGRYGPDFHHDGQ